MLIVSLLAPLALAQAAFAYIPILDKRGCNADNCARAVTATASTSAHSSDCASFLKVTVTPSATTVTVTVSATTTAAVKRSDLARALERRDNTVPAYASACSGSVRYSSACSCFGVTASTTTAAVPTSTVTVTATVSKSQAPSRFTAVPVSGCIADKDAKTIVNTFVYLLASPQADDFNSTAYALFADPFTDTSDSINSLAGVPLGSDTFTDKAAFVTGSGSQPPLYVDILQYYTACNAITWRWVHTTGVGSDVQKVKGIDVFHITSAGTISHVYAEFNSLAFAYDLGSPECASSSKLTVRSKGYIDPRMI